MPSPMADIQHQPADHDGVAADSLAFSASDSPSTLPVSLPPGLLVHAPEGELALLHTTEIEEEEIRVSDVASSGAIRRITRASAADDSDAPTPTLSGLDDEDGDLDIDAVGNNSSLEATAAAEAAAAAAAVVPPASALLTLSLEATESAVAAAVAEAEADAAELTRADAGAEQQQVPEEEETLTEEWRTAERHVFVMSRSGKPIFSRHGNEEKLVTHMGVMTALVSVVEDADDSLHWFESADRRFVFLAKEFLILVCISSSAESPNQLLLQLNYLYNQILSLLTLTVLKRVFRKSNYDLRHLLPDADRFLTGLLGFMERDVGPLLGAVQCLPLAKSARDLVGDAICSGARIKNRRNPDLVFGILLSGTKLVSLVHMKKQYLHPLDMHLIINLINCTESFKTSQAWTPICLPKFDASGNLYAYVCFLDDELCLVLLTVDGESFDALAEAKNKIMERLQKTNCLAQIRDSAMAGQWTVAQTGAEEIRHFVYKIRAAGQYFSPQIGDPFGGPAEHKAVLALYQRMHSLLHKRSRPLKLVYHTNQLASVMGWVTNEFELYAAFSPLASKRSAIQSVNRVLKWLGRERDRLFCLSSPTF